MVPRSNLCMLQIDIMAWVFVTDTLFLEIRQSVLIYKIYSDRIPQWQYSMIEQNIFTNILWLLKVTVIILHAGFVAHIINWRGWAPLSRMTFAVYLIHPLVIFIYVGNRRDLHHVDDFSVVCRVITVPEVMRLEFMLVLLCYNFHFSLWNRRIYK